MDNIMLCKSFSFREFHFTRTHHTDAMCGTVCHHIGYIKAGRADFVTEERTFSFSAGERLSSNSIPARGASLMTESWEKYLTPHRLRCLCLHLSAHCAEHGIRPAETESG